MIDDITNTDSPILVNPQEVPVRMERRRFRLQRFRRIAIFSVVMSCILYVMIPVVPFLSIGREEKASLALGLFIASEVTFWAAAPFLGKEFITKFRQWFSPKKWLTLVKRIK